MSAPKYVQRVARLPQILQAVSGYPDGLPISQVAGMVSVGEETLREDLAAYLDTEAWGWGVDIFRRPVIEFVYGDDDDADDATVLRVLGDGTGAGLGIEHLDAGELALVYTAGLALMDAEPNDDLASALAVVASTMLGDEASSPVPERWNRFVVDLRQAQQDCRRVRIVYSRAWHAGVRERVVEPLRLVQTKRGWELDAGPVSDDGSLRTYLLSHMREVEVLDETFEPPVNTDVLLERQRRTTTVRLEMAQDSRWAADMYAEKVVVVEQDERTFRADLELLPPVGSRVGLLLLASGPDSRLLAGPASVYTEALEWMSTLHDHHVNMADDDADAAL